MNGDNSNGLTDYQMGKVELYRHGTQLGSNYLYMDMHVGGFRFKSDAQTDLQYMYAADPWAITTTPVASTRKYFEISDGLSPGLRRRGQMTPVESGSAKYRIPEI